MSGSHHIVRVDHEPELDCEHYDDLVWREDIEKLLPDLDAVVFADYHKGCIHPTLSHTIISKCNFKNIPVIVDAKKDYEKYMNANVVKCNLKEYTSYYNKKKEAYKNLTELFGKDWVIITKGKDGIDARGVNDDLIWVAGVDLDHIVDTCGAGDVVTAMVGMLVAQKLNMTDVLCWANIAAAESCRYVGVHPITIEDLHNAKKS
jgi:bifunctional ADP-heptose synthase (sugar kinase/adenylyltransferase)